MRLSVLLFLAVVLIGCEGKQARRVCDNVDVQLKDILAAGDAVHGTTRSFNDELRKIRLLRGCND